MSTTLLAVDDSVTMRKVLEITFAGEDYRVVTADSADAALKKAQAEKPSIALVDVTLPGQDGYALCRALKAANPGLSVVILSSKQGPYDAAKGSSAGADDFADKPFDTQAMIEKIRKLVAARAAAPTPAAAPFTPKAPEPSKSLSGTLPGGGISAPSPFAAKPAAPSVQHKTQMFGAPAPSSSSSVVTATKPAIPMGNLAKPQPAAPSPVAPAPAQSAIKPAPTPIPAPVVAAPAPVVAKPAASPVAAAVNGQLGDKLAGLGLTAEQTDAVLALSREVVERVVWEVVPQLAETLIKEEIRRLTAEG